MKRQHLREVTYYWITYQKKQNIRIQRKYHASKKNAGSTELKEYWEASHNHIRTEKIL